MFSMLFSKYAWKWTVHLVLKWMEKKGCGSSKLKLWGEFKKEATREYQTTIPEKRIQSLKIRKDNEEEKALPTHLLSISHHFL